MSRAPSGAGRMMVALGLGCWSGMLGCQSIADIPDVSFSALCKQYCDKMFGVCVGPNKEQYDDPRTCLEVCTAIDQAAKG